MILLQVADYRGSELSLLCWALLTFKTFSYQCLFNYFSKQTSALSEQRTTSYIVKPCEDFSFCFTVYISPPCCISGIKISSGNAQRNLQSNLHMKVGGTFILLNTVRNLSKFPQNASYLVHYSGASSLISFTVQLHAELLQSKPLDIGWSNS